jgi:hypothetical protein
MIRKNKTFLFTVILSLLFILVFDQVALSQPPPPPPGGATGTGHNLNANQGAPLGEGIWILLTLAFSYGLHQFMKRRENKGDESLQDKLVTAAGNNNGFKTGESGLKAFINQALMPFISRIIHNHKK